ncbi:motility protein A [Desulforegula conservatrix]|uniref:motility protein A n=1 Tax=Desulforegula conservatrix TaxID=153026 RepID=UPI00040DCAC8|nr:motility protein A [Desulforegula conservatrix]
MKTRFDLATIIGFLSAFGLIAIAMGFGGGIGIFFDLPSILIVLGGTVGATMINYPSKDVIASFSTLKHAFFIKKDTEPRVVITNFIALSVKARREGILSIDSDLRTVSDLFIKKGLQLTVDGFEPHSIRNIMNSEISSIRERHQGGSEIFTAMGTYAPALGMIGTLIGLVQMLKSMNNPESIGPAMAVALITTFYGAVLSNLVFLPVAGKLRTKSKEEARTKEMIVEGVVSLANGENPRIMEQKMLSFVSGKDRTFGKKNK